ncbi:hypothetical protein AOLI_G00082070 [Acnodon oligacanthus]
MDALHPFLSIFFNLMVSIQRNKMTPLRVYIPNQALKMLPVPKPINTTMRWRWPVEQRVRRQTRPCCEEFIAVALSVLFPAKLPSLWLTPHLAQAVWLFIFSATDEQQGQ